MQGQSGDMTNLVQAAFDLGLPLPRGCILTVMRPILDRPHGREGQILSAIRAAYNDLLAIRGLKVTDPDLGGDERVT